MHLGASERAVKGHHLLGVGAVLGVFEGHLQSEGQALVPLPHTVAGNAQVRTARLINAVSSPVLQQAVTPPLLTGQGQQVTLDRSVPSSSGQRVLRFSKGYELHYEVVLRTSIFWCKV